MKRTNRIVQTIDSETYCRCPTVHISTPVYIDVYTTKKDVTQLSQLFRVAIISFKIKFLS